MKQSSFQRKYRLIGYQFLIPTFLTLLLIVAMPLLFSFVLSMFRYTFLSPHLNEFVGAANYASVFQDQYFWNSVRVTLWFVFMVVPLEFLIGYGIALLLSHPEIRFKSIFYFILTIPMVMSPVAVGLIWRMLLHPELGVVNYLLGKLGFGYINWFGDPHLALFTITLVDVWQQVSFMVLLLLAGLTSLPKEPFESAKIDGANWMQSLLFVKTPLLMPIITTALLQRVVTAFKTYDLVYILTSGGPGVSTDLISYNIYRTTFMGLDLSVASAVSYMLLIVILALTVVIFRSTMKENA